MAVKEDMMKDTEFIELAKDLFGTNEFTVAELMHAVYNKRPRSETPEYRLLTSKLRVLEKRKNLYSRKKGNLKHYRLCKELPEDRDRPPPRKDGDPLLPEEYMELREMVVEGLRTGRIPLSGLMGPDKHLLSYLFQNIHNLINNVKAPYDKVDVRTTPLYIEIVPMA